jgi:plasmid stabilization system protein ParE
MTASPPRGRGGRGSVASPRARVVRWTDRAQGDLVQIGDYIAGDDPVAAERWVTAILRLADRAASLPLAARRVPEIGRDDVREVFFRTYRLVYRVSDKAIDVLTVFEGRQASEREEATRSPSGRAPGPGRARRPWRYPGSG